MCLAVESKQDWQVIVEPRGGNTESNPAFLNPDPVAWKDAFPEFPKAPFFLLLIKKKKREKE